MRYLPHTESEINEMLRVAGVATISELFASIPAAVRLNSKMDLPFPMSESELLGHSRKLSGRNNTDAISFLGAGAYRHYIPAALSQIASRSELVTPYTPYQPEISQGTLQIIFEYQTMMCRLFEMDVSNASHYDGATATAEAALIAMRATKRKKIIVADTLHPEYRETILTILHPTNAKIEFIGHDKNGCVDRAKIVNLCDKETACLIVGYPNFFGVIDSLKDLAEAIHNAGGLFITSTAEPLSMGLIEAPGNIGADIACAEGQSFGGGVNFGGPNLGIFTVKEKLLRSMPGRIVGKTLDADGRPAYVLTFATREQHIRREKATSNICSNEALCATRAAIYLALMGKEGLAQLAELNYALSEYAKDSFRRAGLKIFFNGSTFNEFVVDFGRPAEAVLKDLSSKNIFGGVALGRWYPELNNCALICVTEENSKEEIDTLVAVLPPFVRDCVTMAPPL